jgi:YegS/Rv2252/BmrU family lipid kinase
MANKMRLLVLLNPNASRALEALPQISEWFAEQAKATLVITGKKKELRRMLEQHGAKADRIVIGGGDGTVSKALPILLELNKPLAVLPLGTANDFARTLALPADPLEAATIALSGREHLIDVGLANGEPFLNVASVGAAAKVIRAQTKELKRTWGMLAYPIALLRAARQMQPFVVDLDIDDRPKWSAAVYQVSVGNGRYHGGGLSVAEDAAIDDGLLHLYLVYPGTFWQLFACLTHLRFGLMKPKVLDRLTATRVRLGTARARSVDADGRLIAKTPAKLSVMPQALRVIVPNVLPGAHRGIGAAPEGV